LTVGAITFLGTATSGSICGSGAAHFFERSGTVTCEPSEARVIGTAKHITVPVCDDLLDENDEIFFVRLSAPVNATLNGPGVATATIHDNDPPPVLTISNPSVTEGDSGSLNAVFTVTISAPSGKQV